MSRDLDRIEAEVGQLRLVCEALDFHQEKRSAPESDADSDDASGL
jgi:hypothetical protein